MKDKARHVSMNKNTIQAVFIVLITALFIFFIRANFQQIKKAINIKPYFLLSLLMLNMMNKWCVGFKMQKVMRVFNVRLSFLEWFGSAVINNFYNYLMPKGGTALMGVYFKNKHKLDYNKYVSLLITTGVITVLTSGILGAVVSFYAYARGLIDALIFPGIFTAMFALPVLLFSMPKIRFPHKGALAKINSFLDGWHTLRRDKRTIVLLSLADAGIILLLAMRYYIIFRMFSLNISLINCILISPFNIIVHIGSFIPGGYGVKEAAIGFISRLTNIGFTPGVIATLGERVVMMAIAFILGPIFSFLLLKRSLLIVGEKKSHG